jgi:hypothetical protein
LAYLENLNDIVTKRLNQIFKNEKENNIKASDFLLEKIKDKDINKNVKNLEKEMKKNVMYNEEIKRYFSNKELKYKNKNNNKNERKSKNKNDLNNYKNNKSIIDHYNYNKIDNVNKSINSTNINIDYDIGKFFYIFFIIFYIISLFYFILKLLIFI